MLHLCGERYYDELERPRLARRTTGCSPWTDDFGAALDAADLVARARRRLGVGGRGRGQAGRARPVAERDRRPPDEERALLRGGGRRGRRAGAGARRGCPSVVRELLADGARLAAMGEAMRRAAKPDAADEIAEELIALASA